MAGRLLILKRSTLRHGYGAAAWVRRAIYAEISGFVDLIAIDDIWRWY